MSASAKPSRVLLWLRELRAKFFTVSAMPVLIGAAAAWATTGSLRPGAFALTLLGMLLLHAGANVTNDYFDYVSGADQLKGRENPFAGGSRLIQQGLLSPGSVLAGGLVFLAAGTAVGLALAWTAKSVFLLVLVLVGLFGGYFYTAAPLRIGYTPWGALVCGLCFGPLPVCGTYFLQTGRLDATPVVPGLVCGVLLFLVLLVNGYPDEATDRVAGKRTMVVTLGRRASAWVFDLSLGATYLAAFAGAWAWRETLPAAACYTATLPLAAIEIRYLHVDFLSGRAGCRPNRTMILLHLAGCVMLTAGLVISGLNRTGAFG